MLDSRKSVCEDNFVGDRDDDLMVYIENEVACVYFSVSMREPGLDLELHSEW